MCSVWVWFLPLAPNSSILLIQIAHMVGFLPPMCETRTVCKLWLSAYDPPHDENLCSTPADGKSVCLCLSAQKKCLF